MSDEQRWLMRQLWMLGRSLAAERASITERLVNPETRVASLKAVAHYQTRMTELGAELEKLNEQ